jgi:GDP-L-fucose synthase
MKLLVTGGNGLVGSGIKEITHKYNYDFIFLSSRDCDLKDFNQTKTYFEKIKPDYVIHLAANVGGLFKNMKYKVDLLEDNLIINYNVLKCAYLVNVKKLVACLSTCIFPDKTTYPINEEMLHNGPPHFSNDAYAYAKRMLEIHCKAYQEQHSCNFISVIPTNIYGKHDNFNIENGHVIPGLIHKCYLAKKTNKDFEVLGSGKPLRQFIYNVDLAMLIMWVLEKYTQKDSIILSPDEKDEVSIGHIGNIVAECFNYKQRLTFNKNSSDGQYKKTADNSKLKKIYGDLNLVSIEKGIKESVDWFIKNYDKVRK